MNKRLMAVALSIILVGFFACKKKEQQPVPQAPMPVPGMGAPMPAPGAGAPMPAPGIMMPKGDMQIDIPANIKGQWSAVKLVIEDKATKKTQEYTVKLNSDLQIPNSNLKVFVGEFLPDFRMLGDKITSASNEPNNPAVGIRILDGSNQIFPMTGKKWGWLYAKPELRNIHPLEHPKYGITLKEGLKKG